MCLVNIPATDIPGKSPFYVKIHYKQESGKSVFPVYKEKWAVFNNK